MSQISAAVHEPLPPAPADDPRASPHAHSAADVLRAFGSVRHGLDRSEAARRLAEHGPNRLPQARPPGLAVVFLRQFLNPLIYILLAAAAVSLALGEYSDAAFIFGVLLVNAVIGTLQEYGAERSAAALRELVTAVARVQREGDAFEIDSAELVPGDVVLLESGDKVPADLRLLGSHGLQVDESLLTGESLPVGKQAERLAEAQAPLGDRFDMAFSGTLVVRGRGTGVVVATGLGTELGHIAEAVLGRAATKPPLLLRMERFTLIIALCVGVAVLLMAAIAWSQGTPFREIFFLAVALAVSAIPEGLPVALTVALAIGMRRMARRNVIVRRLVTVEALGSCTLIASDKTGTLTVNELTARRVVLPGLPPLVITGEGSVPEGSVLDDDGAPVLDAKGMLDRLAQAAVLANEGFLGHRDGAWVHHGDAVDVAMLVMARKLGITRAEMLAACPERAVIPFESELRYSASLNATLNQVGAQPMAFVKGALENLLPMCTRMAGAGGDVEIDAARLEAQAAALAEQGYRVLAVAAGPAEGADGASFGHEHLRGLTLLGLVGMLDPLRADAKPAIAACRAAGIEVAMVTGDHPATAFVIARELGLADDPGQLVTGPALRALAESGDPAAERTVRDARVFARVEPQQKLDIVAGLAAAGHFVAVTGDGANDAPALHAAHVGVAMGKRGTDVAREASDMIITDDNFASIVAGVEEGRIAYANVRKVIFLLISTGAAEIVLFGLALFTGLPLPLLAVQLLWLNLVTNGIQDVALAFEPGEGDELARPPRPPRERIFNRIMVERVLISAVAIGVLAWLNYAWLLESGHSVDEARNATLLLMVLFENIHVFNSRSETRSAFLHNPLRNPLLLFGTAIAQLIHIGAMYTPGFSTVLGVAPVSLDLWLEMLGVALLILAVMEAHKWLRWWLAARTQARGG